MERTVGLTRLLFEHGEEQPGVSRVQLQQVQYDPGKNALVWVTVLNCMTHLGYFEDSNYAAWLQRTLRHRAGFV